MQSIELLFNKHAGEDIYILGTGASVRVFPLDMLRGTHRDWTEHGMEAVASHLRHHDASRVEHSRVHERRFAS